MIDKKEDEKQKIFNKKINRTTYHVYASFSETSKENPADKVKRLLKKEINVDNFLNSP